MRLIYVLVLAAVFFVDAYGQGSERVTDVPVRPGVTQRILLLQTPDPKATVVLYAGGHGGLQMFPNGSMKYGESNFLIRSRRHFLEQGFNVLILDAPSDRLSPPYLNGFRQRSERVDEAKAVMAWARSIADVPLWLIGTSRGTQSVGFLATELNGPDAPAGAVLTASIVVDSNGRPVPSMPLERVRIPVLVVHHERDGCSYCPFSAVQQVVDKLVNAPRKELIAVSGGLDRGDPCEALGYHGFNGIEQSTIQQIAAWMLAK